ncbi:ACP phosphodiesterase [Thalassotalea aquiviva]|uniref:acyl carrier protein phosphodiesterase n=1 Tax=Thalassotalea aquiviva TaxID=3242415 RepID=UPI00352A5616
MNYLAHLYFAKKTPESVFGNLLADFCKGIDLSQFNAQVLNGVNNHRAIDRFTDQHPEVKTLKEHLSSSRKRFSFVIADVVFDHFLAQRWQTYSAISLAEFAQQQYQLLLPSLPLMPPMMRSKIELMIEQNWLEGYQDLNNIGRALDGISARLRFQNRLVGAIDEVEQHYLHYQRVFELFFPDLIEHVHNAQIERG